MATSDVEDDQSPSGSPEGSDIDQKDVSMAEPTGSQNGIKKTPNGTVNPKDPNRPRRKKARRACYACQRAHLTCGDERPCQRCIKRGLADACQDGVRKKAKYLHDAPNEALMPGVGGMFKRSSNGRSNSNSQTETTQSQLLQSPQTFNGFPNATQMPPPILDRNMSTSSFHQSPMHAGFGMAGQQPMASPNQSNPNSIITPGWIDATFEPGDHAALFNFDLASMNFGNHYGALEFGMLGHMATGKGETPTSDATTQRGSISNPYHAPLSFNENSNGQFHIGDPMLGDWTNGAHLYNQHLQNAPNAFAIESNNTQFTPSDVNNTSPEVLTSEESPVYMNQQIKNTSVPNTIQDLRPPPQISTPQLKARSQLPTKSVKKARDPSSIYTTVTQPYPYTAGFHSFIAYLQKRFASSPSKTLAIAKSLASIRPSFIATTKTLNRDDLIFMEKCFQRTLFEYEGFIEGVGTPTIVARRTGEIAAVGKEFQILTGWTKNVLLGRASNLNVNKGHTGNTPSGSGANTTGRATGINTPQRTTVEAESGEQRQQPVFLAELLDDETVIQFYEDFARLGYGDSRGSVMGKGRLLKYRTKEDEIARNLKAEADSREATEGKENFLKPTSAAKNSTGDSVKPDGISSQKGMQKLGSADGKINCSYCWHVKRDVFDIPMIIVMNFLPCI